MLGRGIGEAGRQALPGYTQGGRWTKAIFAILLSALLVAGVCKCVEPAFAEEGFFAQIFSSEETPAQTGASNGTVFKGDTGSNPTFTPQGVVKLNLSYKYSNTGGLAGIDVAPSQTVEAIAEKQGDGTYKVTYRLPTKEGFRIVLNPSNLNSYLVNPPVGTETTEQLKEMLENGDFNVDIDRHTVYYYQQESSADHNEQNPEYKNRYSDEYNQAWNDARVFTVAGDEGYIARAVCGDDSQHDWSVAEKGHGANALQNPKIEVTLDEKQLANAQSEGLNITVNYRRNATWYLVKHWVPETLCGLESGEIDALPDEDKKTEGIEKYVCLDKDTLQGRVGATTQATARTHTDNGNADDNPYKLVQPNAFAQKLIENQTTNNETTVDIFYSAASSYRVIFDTDYTYIPRQQVGLNSDVDFTYVEKPNRTGYTFAGWRYLRKDATANADGSYDDTQYNDLDLASPSLTMTVNTIAEAKLQESGGVLALHLVPKWIPNKTQVRVILWTEDLTGTDDVQALAEGGNAGEDSYYTQKYTNYQEAPETHKPQLGTTDSHYSNVHSFTKTVKTDSSLLGSDGSGSRALLDEIQVQVDSEFRTAMNQASDLDVADFYSQAGFEIVHEDEDGIDYNATTASGDGKTTIYVYFTRNVYELKFTYYGEASVNDISSSYCVAVSTNGYSFSEGAAVPDGTLDFDYSESHKGGSSANYSNVWMRANVQDAASMPVPQTITIRAKYGADLRDVWPVARSSESVVSLDNHGGRGTTARMVSWGTTDGKYCEGGFFNSGKYNQGEPTIMGTYAAMSSEIVADPTRPVTFDKSGNVTGSGLRHNLVAYWFNGSISHYRNNHCFEVPDLNVTGMQRVSIHNNNTTYERDFLYLVPTDNPTIAGYGFNDLMRVSYDNGQITYDDPDGAYYAVRSYDGKYYAVARRVETVSSNAINKQNPSARLHMTRANTVADHSTQYADDDGTYKTPCGTEGNPYDLYFYYNRDRYTITYIAPSNNITTGSEVTLGTVRLPYGAQVTKDAYGYKLDYQDTNDAKADGASKYGWELTDTDGSPLNPTAVCPDRADNGTKKWIFKGWALGPAGVNMQWTMNEDAGSGAQAGDTFAIESNMRLYAIWDAPSYSVTFHLNGGTIGNSGNNVVESVPANRRYSSTEAIIPRPLRAGYTLEGWYVADENGNITSPETKFDFDQAISEDKHVAAKWSANSTKTFSYTIYYVTKDPLDGDEDKDKVQVDENGNITPNGGTTYYVLEKSEQTNQAFNPDSTMAFAAKNQPGYVPVETNKVLVMDQANDTYNVVFCYDPIKSRSHTVRFVEAGTESSDDPTIVDTFKVEADQTVATPSPKNVADLLAKGYALVNKNDSDDGYVAVDEAAELKWVNSKGESQEMGTLDGDGIPDTITYLVQPISYTVSYVNANGSPAAAGEALRAVTAGEGTSMGGAGDKNPTLYTAKDSFDVKNPARVWDDSDKKWYVFDGWTLKEGTTTGDGSTFDKTTDLSVGAGTVGALTFVANWREASVVTLDGGTNLVVQKNLTGRDWAAGDSFEFVLEPSNDATTQAVTGNKVKLPDNAKSLVIGKDTADHKASFGDISFFEEGAYTFNVRETKGAIGDITYDGHTATFQVNVTSGDDGQLSAALDGDADLTFLNTYYDSDKAKDVKVDDPASSVDGEAVGVGTELLYTVNWANNALDGNGKPVAANVVVTDVVPDGTELVEGSISEGGSFDSDSKIITWNFENQAPGSVDTVSFKVKVTEDAVENNHVKNAAEVKIGDNAPIVTNKTDNFVPGKSVILPEGGVKVGDELTYTVKYKNTKNEAANITVTDKLPAGLTLVEGSLGDSALYEEDSRTITWNIEGVQPGVEGSVTFKVVVNEGALVKDSTKNTASVAVGDDPAVSTNTTPGFDVEIIETTFDTASVGLSKVLTGRDWLGSDSFEFKLTAVDGAPMPKDDGGNVVDTATVTKADLKDGKAAFGFGEIKFDKAGDYTYRVTETNAGKTINGITYTSHPATFTVHVTDLGNNGSSTGRLAASVTQVLNQEFENTYVSELDYGAKGGLSIFKTLNGRDMAANQFGFTVKPFDQASADKFGIDLAGEEFKNPDAATAGKKSLVKFFGEDVEFSQDDARETYSYVVSETAGGNADEGYTNDTTEYTVTIATEHDPATAALTVTTTVSDGTNDKEYVYTTGTNPDEADAAEVSFVNRYGSSGTLGGDGNVKIDAVKQLTGRGQNAGEFSFVVEDKGGNVVSSGKNAADGTVEFEPIHYTSESLEQAVANDFAVKTADASGKITYELPYKVSEVTSNLPGVVSGNVTSFNVVVKLVDDGDGVFDITVEYPAGMNELSFENTYTSTAPFTPSGSKWLDGGARVSIIDGKFTFTISGEEEAPLPDVTSVKNDAVGDVRFGEITFTQDHLDDVTPDENGARTKTFTYHVTESGTASGITNDAQVTKTFKLTVTDDGQGHMRVESDHQGAQFEFTNTYITTPKESSLTGEGGFTLTKTLDGRDLVDGEFEFDLVDVASGKVVAKGENDESGNVKMGAVTFEEPGTHQYRLVEVNPNESDGITYDASSYDVSAVATDVDFDGVLVIVWSVADTEGTDLKFVNSYKAAPSSITFNAIKQLDGRDIKAGEFEFELVQDGKVIQTAKNVAPDKSGVARITFEPIEYAETGEFDYEIREVKGDAEGVTYDDQVFTYHVTVTDPGTGKLKVEWAQGDNGAPVFKNVYEKQASPLDPVLPPDDGGDDGLKLPQTGDTAPILPLVVLVVLAAGVTTVAVLRLRRR